MKLQTRFLLFFLPLFVASIIAVIIFINRNFTRTLNENIQNKTKLLIDEVITIEKQLQSKALSVATMAATNSGIVDAYRKDSNQAIHDAVKPVADEMAAALQKATGSDEARLHFHIAPVRSLYRTWTDKWNDDLSSFRFTVESVIYNGEALMGIELGKGGMVIRGLHPIKVDGKTVGSVEMYFQPEKLVQLIQTSESNIELILLADKEKLKEIIFEADLEEYYSQGEIGSQMISYVSNESLDPRKLISPEILEKVKAASKSFTDIRNPYSISYIPIKDFRNNIVGFYIFLYNMSSEIESSTLLNTQLTLMLIGINLVLMAALIFWIVKFILRPVKRLDEAVEIISRGSGDLSHRITVKRKDELGTIANNFNIFLESLTDIVSKTRTASIDTNASSSRLSDVSTSTDIATKLISESIRTSQEQITVVSTEMDHSKSYTDIIKNNLEQFQSSIEQLSSIVEESSAGITEMLASLESVNKVVQERQQMTDSLVEMSRQGEDNISETNEQIASLKTSIDDIEEFASMIDGIASQTNLLSMNAAIEAAHAGEAGKGFAVVAEEIRALAETAAEESQNINKAITGIAEILIKTEASGKTSKETFTKIAESVESVSQGLNGIATSTDELALGSREVMAAILEVKNVTIKVKDGSHEINDQQTKLTNVMTSSIGSMEQLNNLSQEMAEKSGEIQEVMNELIRIVDVLSENSTVMQKQINKFKLQEDLAATEPEDM